MKNTNRTTAQLRNIDDVIYIVYSSTGNLGLQHKEVADDVWIVEYSTQVKDQLEEFGVDVPSLLGVYDWPGFYDKPRDVQKQMAQFDLDNHRYWNTSGMRVGKTAGVLWPTDVQMRWEELNKVLILCPKSALERTWHKEIMSIMPQVATYYSTGSSTKPLKEALLSSHYRIMVINYDKFWRCLSEVLQWGPEKIIADEASEANDRRTKRAKALRAIFKDRDYIKFVAMTGTPLPNRPTDIWSVGRFICEDMPGNYHQFETSIMTPAYPGSRKLIAQPWAKKVVTELMVPNIYFSTDDVPGMPEHETIGLTVDMGVAQAKAFKELKAQYYTELMTQQITVQDAGSRLWKLVQVSAGSSISDDGMPMVVGAPAKLEECKRIIQEASGKVVIFARYKAVQDYIMKGLEKQFDIRLINGETKDKDQSQWIKQFQMGMLDALLLNPDMFKYAEQLDAGSANIWWHPVHSALVYEQASSRIRGVETGVTSKTVSFNLQCNSFERKIYETVLQRIADQNDVKAGVEPLFDELDLFTKLILESTDDT